MLFRKFGFHVVLALMLCLFASSAFAATLYDGISGREMVRILQDMGYETELSTSSSGNPLIDSRTQGVKFQVYFYSCKNKVCEDIQFYSGFTQQNNPSSATINEWNTTKRFGRAYLADDGDSRIEMDATLTGGVTGQHVRDLVGIWEIVLRTFLRHIDW